MARKNTRNTRGKIVNAAWKLFYEQGYEYTTVEEIIDLSGTSKGSFYHYFDGKDALLSTLSTLFDDKYQDLIPLLDHNRIYYRLLRKIISDGQSAGQLTSQSTVNEMVKLYALCERALLYDWCLCGGEYSLRQYSKRVLPGFLSSFLP